MSNKIPYIGLAALLLITVACRNFADTPLTMAAAKGDSETVMALLDQGADPNDMDSEGLTPLMWAARYGHEKIITILCEAGADLDLRQHGGNHWTALIHAIHKGQSRAAILLMDNGADVNAKARGGASALMLAAGYNNTPVVEALLDHGADPYATDAGGVTPLSNAVGGAWDIDRPFVGACQTETVKALFKAAPDLTLSANFQSRAAMWFAKRKGCTEIVSIVEKSTNQNPIASR